MLLCDRNVTVDHKSWCQFSVKRTHTVHHVYIFFNNSFPPKKAQCFSGLLFQERGMDDNMGASLWNKRGGGHEREIEETSQEKEEG